MLANLGFRSAANSLLKLEAAILPLAIVGSALKAQATRSDPSPK